MSESTADEVLSLPMTGDFEDKTVRDYLVDLLAMLWSDEGNFNSKRPFGNSGWAYDLYEPLIKAGLIRGQFDEAGYIDDVDIIHGDRLIAEAIESLRAT